MRRRRPPHRPRRTRGWLRLAPEWRHARRYYSDAMSVNPSTRVARSGHPSTRVARSERGARVVISGIGVVSPFGVGRDRFWQGISHGCSGTKAITEFDVSSYPCQVAASVPPVSIADASELEGDDDFGGRADPRRYSRAALFGVIAAREAWRDAGLRAGDRIVEMAASLPENFKIRGGTLKYILRQLMKDKLPPPVIRRKKEGFDIPIHEWFRGPLRPLLLDTLTEDAIVRTGLFRPERVRSLIQTHLERRANVGYHLWGLLILFLWLRIWNIDTASAAAYEMPERSASITSTAIRPSSGWMATIRSATLAQSSRRCCLRSSVAVSCSSRLASSTLPCLACISASLTRLGTLSGSLSTILASTATQSSRRSCWWCWWTRCPACR